MPDLPSVLPTESLAMHSDSCHCTRRSMIRSLVGGSLLVAGHPAGAARGESRPAGGDPLAPKPPHFAPRAKRVIFLNMSGGVSHVDSFDYKPKLIADHNKPFQVPQRMLEAFAPNNRVVEKYFKRPQWEFKQRGQSGLWISDLFPHVAECADDLCLIRSMRNDHPDHFQATLGIHTGSVTFARPSIGAWVSYGLGTVNRNLPSFIVLAPQLPYAGGQVWASDFLPGCHQGTHVVPGPEPMPNIQRASARAGAAGDGTRPGAGLQPPASRAARAATPNLAARIRSFETAFGMQAEAPEAFDLSQETDATLRLYGLPRGSTRGFAWQCLVARRLAERGVRFVELIDTGASNNWDSHGDMNDHGPLAKNVDQPIAGLLKDLKQPRHARRHAGRVDDGVRPHAVQHGPRTRRAASITPRCSPRGWPAAASRAASATARATTTACSVAANEVHIHDFHATILHLLGLDHERLTYRHAGRDFRLTDVAGRVVREIIA